MDGSKELILVTGGAGFIGSHTVTELLDAGYRVRVLDNFSTGKRENLPRQDSRLDVRDGDVTNAADMDAAAAGTDACIHLAAQVSVEQSFADPVHSANTNIIGFLQVREAARRHGLHKVVYASSAAVYGNPESLPLSETATTRPLSPYGIEKLCTEQYAAVLGDDCNTHFLGMRYFNVYGPRQDPASPYSGVISKFCERMSRRQRPTLFGDGRQTRDFVYVGDVARANVAALSSAAQGAINVCTGEAVSLLQLVDCLARIHGVLPEFESGAPRHGDIRHSCGNPARMRELLGVAAACDLATGLASLVEFETRKAA